MAKEVHIGDVGTIFRVELYDEELKQVVDVSAATVLSLHFLKPDGKGGVTKVPKTAVLSSGGVDGLIEYIGVAGFLDTPGNWRIQAEITFAGGNKWNAEVGKFIVHENIH